jgi:hypothetical protein
MICTHIFVDVFFFSLTDLQNQLTAMLLKQCPTVAIKETDSSYVEFQNPKTNVSIQEVAATASSPAPVDTKKVYVDGSRSNLAVASDSEFGPNRKRNPIIVTPAWCYSEALTGLSFCLMEDSFVLIFSAKLIDVSFFGGSAYNLCS